MEWFLIKYWKQSGSENTTGWQFALCWLLCCKSCKKKCFFFSLVVQFSWVWKKMATSPGKCNSKQILLVRTKQFHTSYVTNNHLFMFLKFGWCFWEWMLIMFFNLWIISPCACSQNLFKEKPCLISKSSNPFTLYQSFQCCLILTLGSHFPGRSSQKALCPDIPREGFATAAPGIIIPVQLRLWFRDCQFKMPLGFNGFIALMSW